MERYYSLNQYFKNKYGEKVGKLSLDGGFSCPNRDGTLSTAGCIFCSEKGSGDFTNSGLSIRDQIERQKKVAKNKWKVSKFVAYFQAFTNTYGPVDILRKIYYQVLDDPEIVGLAIATRADCLSDEILDLLEELSKLTDLWIEIGMQSVKEETIDYINRGYSHKYLDQKLKILRKRKIKFLLHVIFGLPGEDEKDMLVSINYLNESGAFGIKIHSLYIQNDSVLYKKYLEDDFTILTKDQYTDLVVQALGLLNDDIVVHRITGDGDKNKLVAPLWSADKLSVIGEINRKLKIVNTKKERE
ncbi:TIGR01212 family radical SAM protein [Neofamilia massiliensis]|uniref:TIGR01212 family radical SAM protein n=1 Tax=Neofamilia massiliensis TaxID=1673724 RepID=UPI0006BB69E8|nr:TIGR01212 family radical SAM protein [Neofamilia massiliensis]